jgi:putative membrane protein
MLRIVIAALHLIALGLGLGAVLNRGKALRETPATQGSLGRALRSDVLWGIAALLWIGTGLWRLLGGIEKGAAYYMHNPLFHAKLTFVMLILALEIWPMLTLLRWRKALMRGDFPDAVADPAVARRIAIISHIQATLVVIIVFLAVAMARGYGVRAG